METENGINESVLADEDQPVERVQFDFALSRRSFVQILGAGLVIAASAATSVAQDRGGGRGGRGGGGRPINLDARLHIAKDGSITVMTGKVEGGQGARTQLTQAAAEELHVSVDTIRLVMGDTALCPDDGPTVGSRTTPATLPAVRNACAAAFALLQNLKSKRNAEVTFADLASAEESADALKQAVPRDVVVTKVDEWKVLGTPVPRPNQLDLVTGEHRFPADIIRPGMLYGKILRAPSYGATLKSIDVAPAKAMEGVVVVQDGNFVGVAAPNTYLAKKAIRALEATAQWEPAPHPSSNELFEYLRRNARNAPENQFTDEMKSAAKALRATYDVAYVQHTPMEPRAAVAEFGADGKLTVWTSTQGPFRVRQEVSRAVRMTEENVRVIVPDFGGGFGGKHTGETAVEAARLAQAAGKPVAVRWTRPEELTWAYFRPASVIDIQASLDAAGALTSWYFLNINSGGAGINSPYRVSRKSDQTVNSNPPLRHGSYRALAATANNFARESFMDELADAAGKDPLAFRLAHLDNDRLRAVLEEAANRFNWNARRLEKMAPGTGVGLACGMEKGSYVAACAEVTVDRSAGKIVVKRICEAFECGAITSPANLMQQVRGGIIQALGPALREAMEFEGGKILNASLWKYQVPRFADVPELDIHLMNRSDLQSVGAGETPVIAVAPAIANAVSHATGTRLRQMPLRLASGT